MKEKYWLLAFFVGVLGLAFFLPGRESRGQRLTLQNFEYKIVAMNPQEYSHTTDFQKILREKKEPGKAQLAFYHYVCNYMGSQGWELVQVDRPGQNKRVFYLYFKRKKP